MRLDLRGAEGDLRASYQPAATFGAWRLKGDTDTGCTLTAPLYSKAEAFMGAALVLHLVIGNKVWEFTVDSVLIDETTAALTVYTRGMPRMSPL